MLISAAKRFGRVSGVMAFAGAMSLALAACGGAESKSAATDAGDAADAAPTAETATTTDNKTDHANALASDMVLGDPNAPVTVIEYASVTCPHCATFHQTMFPEIKKKYVDTGKVKFVFREFPTAPVNFSLIGSVLARCSAEKGGSDAYFAVLGSLFKEQRTWIYGEDPKAELLKIAGQAGISGEEAFNACLNRQDFVDLINENTKVGVDQFKITGTPSFVLEGKKIPAGSLENFEKALDEALAAKAGDEG